VADAPWRCSQCGTVNEPAANSCRTCGRWPSLFDLEQSALDDEPETVEETYEPESYEPATYAPDPVDSPEAPTETGEPAPRSEPAPWRGPEPAIPQRQGARVKRLSRFAIPLIVLAYVLITSLRH